MAAVRNFALVFRHFVQETPMCPQPLLAQPSTVLLAGSSTELVPADSKRHLPPGPPKVRAVLRRQSLLPRPCGAQDTLLGQQPCSDAQFT